VARTRIFATYTYRLPPTTNHHHPKTRKWLPLPPFTYRRRPRTQSHHFFRSEKKKSPLTCFSPIQMISEVTPRGKEFLFFSLFSIIGKTSSFIGPFISSAIIDDTGNNSSPFYFLFALSLASFLFLLFFVDVKQSRVEQADFLERERLLKEEKKKRKNSTW